MSLGEFRPAVWPPFPLPPHDGGGADLDLEALRALATRDSGLCDFGPPAFMQAAAVLVDSLRREGRLNARGRARAVAAIRRSLQVQLWLQHEVALDPAVSRRPVASPVVIVGMAGAGMERLQRLLVQDPANRTPAVCDPRAPAAALARPVMLGGKPAALSASREAVAAPLEEAFDCAALLAHGFVGSHLEYAHRAPAWAAWCRASADWKPVYAMHRRLLQMYRGEGGAPRWILASADHLRHLREILAVYPDAHVIHVHRDPAAALAEAGAACCAVRRLGSEEVDAAEIGQAMLEDAAWGVDRMLQQRHRAPLRGRVLDILHHDLCKDPIGTVELIYGMFAIPFTVRALRRMQEFVRVAWDTASAPALAAVDLSAAAVHGRFADYMDLHGIRREVQ
ncbi:MAG: sulfotransferase [Gammaproteobacteria bacterium]